MKIPQIIHFCLKIPEVIGNWILSAGSDLIGLLKPGLKEVPKPGLKSAGKGSDLIGSLKPGLKEVSKPGLESENTPGMEFARIPLFRRKKFLIALFSLIFISIPIGFLSLKNARPTAAAWFDDTFAYRKAIAIPSHTSAENNVYVTVPTFDATDTSKFQADCGDLRFTKQNGELLPYYVVDCDATATVHVQFDTLPAGASTYFMYYGNPSADNGFSATDFSTAATGLGTQTLASEEKSAGPVAYWKFDEGYGTSARDSSVSSNNQTFSGTTTWASEDQCISGKCLKFDGTTNTFTSNSSVDFDVLKQGKETSSWTLAAWVKPSGSQAGSEREILGRAGCHGGIYAYANDFRFAIKSSACWTNAKEIIYTPSDMQSWHYLVAVYNNRSMSFYADGKLVGSDTFSATMYGYSNIMYVGGIGGYEFKGFIDEPKIYNYARTAAQIKSDFTSRGAGKGTSASLGASKDNLDALSNGLVGYWKMDEASWTVDCSTESVTDSSGNSNNGASCPNSTGATGGNAGKYGNGGTLDGTNDYIDVDDNSNLDFGTGAFSISFWGKSNITAGVADYAVGKLLNGTTYDGYHIGVNSSGYGTFIWRTDSTNYAATGTTDLTDNNWHHYVGFRNSSGIYLYVDGALVGSNTNVNTQTNEDNDQPLAIGGARTGDTGELWAGSLDDVRIYNRALSPKEVRDLYAWAPGPVGYWNMDEGTGTSLYDKSGNGLNSSSLTGTVTWSQGKFGKSLYFNKNLYADMGNPSLIDGLKQFTVGTWIKLDSLTTTPANEVFISKVNGSCAGNGWRVEQNSAVVSLTCGTIPGVSITIPDTNWHYIAYTVGNDGTNFSSVSYLDGVQKSTNSAVAASLSNAFNLYFGDYTSGGSPYNYKGKLDEIRIYNYARTSKQIVEDMNAGHPVGGSPVGSQVGYWKFDEGYGTTTNNSGNGGSTYNATLASSPNTPTWNNEGKFGKALNFDGSNDYTTINTSLPTLTEGSISMWVKRTATTATYQMLFTDAGSQFEMAWINASTLTFYVNNVGVSTSTAANLNTWYHIAGTFSETGNYQRIYVNGILANSSTYPGDATTATKYFGSRAGSYPFAGLIDEIKVYNSALTEDEIKLDYNHGSAMVLGTLSDTSGLTGGSVASSSASAAYCIPGDTTSCSAPVGEWKMDEKTGASAYDTSGNGNTGTWNGTGSHWGLGKYGASGNFNGSDDYILSSNYNESAGQEFTASVWFYPTVNQSSNGLFSHKSNGVSGWFIAAAYGTSNTPAFFTSTGGTLNADTTFTLNSWNHLEVTFQSGTKKIYINGRLAGSQTGASFGANNIPFTIGRYHSDEAVGYFTGRIDQIRYYNYARTPAQIAWDYNRGAPVGWWKMDECQGGTAYDSGGSGTSGNNGTITIGATGSQTAVGTCTTSGTAWYNGVTGKYNSSLNFDGTDDFAKITSATGGILNPLNYLTLSAWVYWKGNGTGKSYIISKGWEDVYDLTIETNGKPRFRVVNAYPDSQYVDALTAINQNQWYLITGTYDQQTLRLYINGVQVNTSSYNKTIKQNSSPFKIGANQQGGEDFANPSYWQMFNGQIDDVRIYNYALTPLQIKTLYNENSAVRFGPLTGSP